MRPGKYCALVLGALLGVWGLWPAGGAAEEGSRENQIEATYRVDLSALNLGEAHVTADLNGSAYEVRAKGRFSLVTGMLYRASGTTMSAGTLSKSGPQPAKFTLSYEGGSKKEMRQLRFADGAVSDISIVPRKKHNPRHRVPITKEQLENVLDPLTAAFLYARSGGPPGDIGVCRQTVPVFDGKQRFDIVLKPKRTDVVDNDAPAELSGSVAVCQVKYVPIGGYRPDHPGIKFMTETDDIEVWLVPVPGSSLYIPYRVVMPTAWGTGSVTLTEIKTSLNGSSPRDD
jgi:hypothetical protein